MSLVESIDREGLPHSVWRQIQNEIARQVKEASSPQFTQGEVVKSDPLKMLVWLEEFGSQPIPVFTFDYQINYYDTLSDGTLEKRQTKAVPLCPSVGDTVLVARQYGSRLLPKCIGVLRSRDFVLPN